MSCDDQSRRRPVLISGADLDDNTRLLIAATVDELVQIASRARFTIRDLNHLLDSGMELNELVDYMASTLLKRAA